MMILGLLLIFILSINRNRGLDCSLTTIQSVSNCNEVDIRHYEYNNVDQTDWEDLTITALYAAGTIHPGFFLAGLAWKTIRGAVEAKETQALNEAFQDKINAEFNRLQGCIDDKIENRFHFQAQKDLYEFIDTFEELKDHSEADFSDKYMHLVDSVRNFVGSTFNANVDTLLTYKSYLPVFRATVNFYNGLIIGYLLYLENKCGSTTNDQQLFCDRLSTYMNLGLKDVGDLLNWAHNARDYIEQSYIPSITKNNYDNGCRVSDSVVVQSTGGQFFHHDYRAIAKIVWGKEDIMYAFPDKLDMYSPDHLSAYLNIITPEVNIVCDISGTIECPTYDYRPQGYIGDHVEKPEQECCDNMGRIGTYKFNTILTQINNWHREFNLKYIQPIQVLFKGAVWTVGTTIRFPGDATDIGEAAFNTLFRISPPYIIRRECPTCANTYRVIYYRRITPDNTWNAYKNMRSDWFSQNNILNTNFILTNDLAAAIAGNNQFATCNYDDAGIGSFRDCGHTGLIGGQWTSVSRGGHSSRFSIYTPDWTVATTVRFPGDATDIGEEAFNALFRNTLPHIIRRECPTCVDTHKVIYYRRITPDNTWNAYKNMRSDWFSQNNILNTNFILTNDLAEAIAGNNQFATCNYDDAGIGSFRDCGHTGLIGGQWTSVSRGGHSARFSIYTPKT